VEVVFTETTRACGRRRRLPSSEAPKTRTVEELRAWRTAAGITFGPIFRNASRQGKSPRNVVSFRSVTILSLDCTRSSCQNWQHSAVLVVRDLVIRNLAAHGSILIQDKAPLLTP
jgi:hypothetical protein